MIAKNIAHRAVLAGRSVLFLSAAQMLLDLGAQESARALERRLSLRLREVPSPPRVYYPRCHARYPGTPKGQRVLLLRLPGGGLARARPVHFALLRRGRA